MRIYPICIVPFPLNSFFSMVLVRLYGNSWKWQILRRCFAEWIIRMDQFGEMSKTKQVVHAETSRSGACGKRTIHRLYNNFDIQTMPGSRVAMKVLPERSGGRAPGWQVENGNNGLCVVALHECSHGWCSV